MKTKPRYTLEDKKLIAYAKLSAEQKLKWLHDASIFNAEVFNEKDKKIRQKIKDKV